MDAKVSTKITIDATAAEVFDFLADLKHHYLWNPQVHAISTTEKLQLGTSFRTESLVLGMTIKSNNKVVSFTPPKELTIQNPLGNISYTATFRLSPQGGKTSVQLEILLSTKARLFTFTRPILKQLALRELRTDLRALKVAVENNVP